MRRYILFFTLGVFVSVGVGAQAPRDRLLQLGLEVARTPADPVDFELNDLDEKPVKLSSLKGKFVFLNFWATWCGPCRTEMPSMERMYRQLREQGLEILAVDLQEDKKTIQRFAKELGLTFPILMDSRGRVGADYDARAIPTTYLLDRRGLIIARAVGARSWDTPDMLKVFRSILKDGAGF